MNYPLISEYVEAIKAAEDNFDQLKHLRPVLGEDVEPVMTSGNFAVVFKMKDEQTGKLHAVKCFLKEQEGRAEAYCQIAEELEYVSSTFLTPIKYLDKELFVDSANSEDSEFPVLLMDWVEGQTLDKYIREHIDDQYELSLLAYQFSRLAMWLMPQPFAHGDLKPDNILVKEDGTLVLVDYDGMYVPAMKGQKARELGSPDFRHPSRTEEVFDDHIDDFSLASILLSLKAIALQPSLLEEYGASDRLLFSENDYRNLSESSALGALQPLMQDAELASLYSLYILALSQNNLSQVSFRLFNLSRPDKSQYEEENLSTEVTKEDWLNVWKDKNEFIYSSDKKRLLIAHYDSRISPIWVNQIYNIKKGTKVICNNAFAPYQYYLEKGMFYELNYKKELVSNNCELGSVLIPEGVIKIGCNAFKGCKYLKSIDLPNSVEEIGCSAFEGCESLVSFIIPTRVTEIEESSFKGCSNLTALEIHNDIVEIGTSAFEDCSNLTSFIVPKKVTVIRKSVFEGCYNLSSITFSEKLISIGENAFSGCENLTSIVIPEGVQKIGKNAFWLCLSLSSVILPDSLEEIGDYTFMYCQNLQSIIVPNNVTTIGEEAFKGCSQLTEVLLHNSIEIIGNKVFSDCDSLGSIFIPKGTKNKFEKLLPDYKDKLVEQDKSENLSTEVTDEDLANAWVDGCGVKYSKDRKRLLEANDDLEIYTIYNGTIIICNNSFTPNSWSSVLKHISVPDSVKIIGEGSFSGCEKLSGINLPNKLLEIGDKAFDHCKSLTTIIIPNEVSVLNNFTFAWCEQLSSVHLSDGLKEIGDSVFSGCKCLSSINLPNDLEKIGRSAFYGCKILSEVVIPDKILVVNDYTFDGCLSLQKVLLPNRLVKVGSYAFRGCGSITTLTIPNSVEEIGDYAFSGCRGLVSISMPISIMKIGKEIFRYCNELTYIFIPNGSKNKYEVLLPEYKEKLIEQNSVDGYSTVVTKDDLANSWVDEYGVMYSADRKRLLKVPDQNLIHNYSVLYGTRIICNKAFRISEYLKNVIIPSTVTQIGDEAFAHCQWLNYVNLPNSVKSIGVRAFDRCVNLEVINIPNSITQIGNFAFESCALNQFKIPKSVTSLGINPFVGCNKMESLTCESECYIVKKQSLFSKDMKTLISCICKDDTFPIPSSVNMIGDYAFSNNEVLRYITIPDSVSAIGRHAFSMCRELRTIIFNNLNIKIGDGAFFGCYELKRIVIPKGSWSIFADLLPNHKRILLEQ